MVEREERFLFVTAERDAVLAAVDLAVYVVDFFKPVRCRFEPPLAEKELARLRLYVAILPVRPCGKEGVWDCIREYNALFLLPSEANHVPSLYPCCAPFRPPTMYPSAAPEARPKNFLYAMQAARR